MRYIRAHKFEIGIFILAVLVRLALFGATFTAHERVFEDTISGADGYFVISQNILAGHGYSSQGSPPYVLNSIRPPVQPYFLAGAHVLFGGYWGPFALQILMGGAIALLGIALARYFTLSKKAPYAVGILLAVEPLGSLFSTIFYAETTCTFLLLLALLCFFKYIDEHKLPLLLCAGAALGLSTLAKPTVEYVALLCSAALAWHYRATLRKELPRIALFALTFLLVLSPWVYRNWSVFGVAGVSPQLGEQLNVVLVPSVLSMENGTTFDYEYRKVISAGGADTNTASIASSSEYLHRALPILLAHPKALALTMANTALNFFIHDGVYVVLDYAGAQPKGSLGKPALFLLLSDPGKLFGYIKSVIFEPTIAILFARVFWIMTTILFVAGSARIAWHHDNTRRMLGVAVVIYFMLTTLIIGIAVTGRYRLPVNAIILSVAVSEAVVLTAAMRRRFDVTHGL